MCLGMVDYCMCEGVLEDGSRCGEALLTDQAKCFKCGHIIFTDKDIHEDALTVMTTQI
jgi:hypothetical protein